MSLPSAFLNQIKLQLGEASALFVESLATSSPTAIRINPKKETNLSVETTENVSWNKNGFYLPQRPIFTLDPSFHAGAYYVQEASSMFLAYAIDQIDATNRPLRVLDLCAAPGGKSTLLASILHEDSLLLCNEVIKSRVGILQQNMEKWGYPNVHISNHDSKDFSALNGFFDVVVVDAPCSGEGLFRKDEKAIKEWSPENVQLCSARQRRILAEAVALVKEGGHLIYSTCTYNDAENEHNAKWLVNEMNLSTISLDPPSEWGIVKKELGYQFYPHLVKGEGLYLACFQKPSTTAGIKNSILRQTNFSMRKLPKKLLPIVSSYLEEAQRFDFFQKKNGQIVAILKSQVQDSILLDQHLFRKGLGLQMGQFKREDFIPSHQLALSTAISKQLPQLPLDKNQALKYLKKESFPIDAAQTGWMLAQYNGLNLGWLKVLKNRMNNYYPKEWRIRMAIP